MGKPIWELEPEVIDAELARARRAHDARSETPGKSSTSKPSTTTPPPLPAAFAGGTNRSRGAGPVSPPPMPAVALRGKTDEPPRVIEMEADYDVDFGEFEEAGGKTEFEAIQSTAEIEAPLLSELRAQTKGNAKPATASGRRVRQPAITPTYPLKPSEMARTTPRAAAVPRPATSVPLAAKASYPVTTPTAPAAPRTVGAEVPSKVVSPSDTSYSMVRKQAPSTPPKKR